ncbi:hypothetical protein KKH18_06620, partial [bacterium]|nr:hypothetical protein [bacterium]
AGDSLWISDILASDWTTTITDIVETSEGGFALCGNGSAPGQDFIKWILRTTPDGSITVTHSLTVIREGDGVRLRWSVNPELSEVVEGYRVYCSTSLDVPFENYLGFATDTTFVHETALAESDLFYYFVVSKYGFAAAANRQGQGALKRVHSAEPQNVPARTPFYGH